MKKVWALFQRTGAITWLIH